MPIVNPTLPNDGEDADAADVSTPIAAILAVLNGGLDGDNLSDNGVLFSKLATVVQQALLPTGTILTYGGATAPSGYLLCYGQAVSRSTYSSLFTAISTAFGVGNGTTTFNLPDLRGRTPAGNDAMGGTAANVLQCSSTLTTTSGSPTATVGSATGLVTGMTIVSTNVTAGTTISAISGTTLTLSGNATGSGTNVAARFSVIADAQALGSLGGVGARALTYRQLPFLGTNLVVTDSPFAGNLAFPGGGSAFGYNVALRTGLATATAASVGENSSIVQPGQIVNYMIKT